MIKKAYHFRLKTTPELERKFVEIAGCCRFVWNHFWRFNRWRLENHYAILRYHEMDFWTKLWKRAEEYHFLAACPAHALQQKLRDLDRAYRDGFDRTQPQKRLPKLHKKGVHDSFRFPEPKHIQIENRRIKLPKVGWVGFYKSQAIIGTLKNVTIARRAGRWYLSIQVECKAPAVKERATAAVGIDMGISQFAALSSGGFLAPVHSFRSHAKRLARIQRNLSKKQRFSNNWKKQVKRLQKFHTRVANIRRDFLHKASTQLSKSHAMIVIEALKITNMSQSARGTLESPGRNVRAKSGLNKSILDQGWGEFRRQLGYKLTWLGGLLVEVPPQHTSQRCSRCGHTEAGNRINQAQFCCQNCGYLANADINAAKNILAAGHAVLACGEEALVSSVKQEPLGIGNLVPA